MTRAPASPPAPSPRAFHLVYSMADVISGLTVPYLKNTFIQPNWITVGWTLLLVLGGCALAVNARIAAVVMVICAITLDCIDGDLARCRNRSSEAGTLLEQIGHWIGNMSIAAGAGAALHRLYPRTNTLLPAGLYILQVVYIAVIRQLRPMSAGDLAARGWKRFLVAVLRINFYLSPVELAIVIFFLLFGLSPATVGAVAGYLLASSLLLFIPNFAIALAADRKNWDLSTSDTFPGVSVLEADGLLASRRSPVTWYGPAIAKVSPQVLQAGAAQPMDPNSDEFSAILADLHPHLQEIFRSSGRVIPIASSGAGAMETAARSILRPGDRALVLDSGASGRLWRQLASEAGAEVMEVDAPYCRPVPLDRIEEAIHRPAPIRAVFATLCEPESGSTFDIGAIAERLRGAGAIFVVDVTAGLASDDFRMDEWGVDVAVGASHTGLMAPPGVGLIALSARLERSALLGHPIDGLTYPLPTQVVCALNLSARMITVAGLDHVLDHRRSVASSFRRGCLEVLGLSVAASNPSAACTTVKLPPDISALKLHALVKERHSIGVLTGKLPTGEETLILGHSGWMFRDDIYNTIEALALSLEVLKTNAAGGADP